MRVIKVVFLICISVGQVFSQDETGKIDYFEGLIKYVVEVTGKNGRSTQDLDKLLEKKPCRNMDMYFKESDFIINMYNGEFPTTRLFIADSNRTFTLDVTNQRAFRFEQYQVDTKTPPTAVPTGNIAKVAGIDCKEYKVVKPDEEILYYISDKYRVNVHLFKGKTNAQANFLTKGLNGCIPLKTIRKTNKYWITVTAVKIEKQKLQTQQFRIPNGWKLTGTDLRR